MPTPKLLDDDDFFARAIRAYRRACDGVTEVCQQPSSDYQIDGNTITLSNQNGDLARYEATRVGAAGKVRLVRLPLGEVA